MEANMLQNGRKFYLNKFVPMTIYKNQEVKVIKIIDEKIFKNKKIDRFIQIGSGLEYGNIPSPQKENIKCFPQSNYGLAKFKSSKYLSIKVLLTINVTRLSETNLQCFFSPR